MNDCCVRYVQHAMDCHIEWAHRVRDLVEGADDDVSAGSYLCAMEGRDHAGDPLGGTIRDLLDIVEGRKPCPWHGDVPEDYLAAMHATGMPKR